MMSLKGRQAFEIIEIKVFDVADSELYSFRSSPIMVFPDYREKNRIYSEIPVKFFFHVSVN